MNTSQPSNQHTPTNLRMRLQRWLMKRELLLPKNKTDLLALIRRCAADHTLDANELARIEGVLTMSKKRVRDCMIPRAQMVCVQHDAPTETILNTLLNSHHSRFPVEGEDRDQILGLVLAKDVLKTLLTSNTDPHLTPLNLDALMLNVAFIPESKRLDVLLNDLRNHHSHMAMVVDEYGGVSGLITIEDVLEEIVGEIEDEHFLQDDANLLHRVNAASYWAYGTLPLTTLDDTLGTEVAITGFDTLGGWLAHEFGHIPSAGDSIQRHRITFTIRQADPRRINLVDLDTRQHAAKR